MDQVNINVYDFLDYIRDYESDLYEHLCDLLNRYCDHVYHLKLKYDI